MPHKEQHLSVQGFQGKLVGTATPGWGRTNLLFGIMSEIEKKVGLGVPLVPLNPPIHLTKNCFTSYTARAPVSNILCVTDEGFRGRCVKTEKTSSCSTSTEHGRKREPFSRLHPQHCQPTQITGLRKGRQPKSQDQGCIHQPLMIRHPTTKYHRIHHLTTHPWPSANNHTQPLDPTPGYFWKYEELGCLV